MENHSQEKHAKWRKLVEEQQASGLSQKEFCMKRELVLSQFVYYRCQIKNVTRAEPAVIHNFAPVKISSQEKGLLSTEIKLLLPNGFQCIFPSQIEANQVKRLVEVLLSC
jgi:hypothetical protein